MAEKQKGRRTQDLNHPSDELVSRTLEKMNQRLAENRTRCTPAAAPRTRWIRAASLAAAAAALCILLLSQTQARLEPLAFTYQPDPRLSAVNRTEAGGQSDLTALRAGLDAQLQPIAGCTRTDFAFYDFALNENSPVMWFASAQYEGERTFSLTVTNFATTLHQALADAAPAEVNGCAVRAGVDSAAGGFFAVWQAGERYVQLALPNGAALRAGEQKELIRQTMEMLN